MPKQRYRIHYAHSSLDPLTRKALGINDLEDAINLKKLKRSVDNSTYGIPTEEINEAASIWIPFNSQDTKEAIEGRDRLILYLQTPQFKKYESPLHSKKVEQMAYTFTNDFVFGFQDIDSVRNYIELTQNWISKEEIFRNIQKVTSSLNTNEKNFEWDWDKEIIGSVVRLLGENPKAIKRFKIWFNPDIWLYTYDLSKSNEKRLDIILSSNNIWYPPEYEIPTRQQSPVPKLVDSFSA